MHFTANHFFFVPMKLRGVERAARKNGGRSRTEETSALDDETVETTDAIILASVVNLVYSEEKVKQLNNFARMSFTFLSIYWTAASKLERCPIVSANF